ncbi:regulator of G-protein signaling 14 isoform X1 [Erpetoichthys calabaricus]|uniref:regulator of G-protein signaling 14 isoform X1 n=1 Tax=Erpetoichthys calabaricus TaxID=27687 RepID=UPI002233F1B0|nr:regulator of G-protein signaling 14 isoform X1 [Erpetoichthys calabaricus]
MKVTRPNPAFSGKFSNCVLLSELCWGGFVSAVKMRMLKFQEFSKGLTSLTPKASFHKKFTRYNTFNFSCPREDTNTLAASDGELNSSDVAGCSSSYTSNSNTSLPSIQRNTSCEHGSVASWAVSFERLLQDPIGVQYFTAFLKSEVSAENILFWEACEKFRVIPEDNKDELAKEAKIIYDTYLCSSALNAINIDDSARLSVDVLEKPTADMFSKPQLQIFKLMKFDSYARFVKSQLYQKCMLANVEGKPLPDICADYKSPGAMNVMRESSAVCDIKKKKKLKARKSLPFETEANTFKRATQSSRTLPAKIDQSDVKEKRGSLGDFSESSSTFASRRESQCSVHSATSLELGTLGSLSSKSENGRFQDAEKENPFVKYCCVYFPDETASLAPARPGYSIREMLSGMCEKRGIPLSMVSIYLQGKDKPLSLDQDSSVLMDQQVRLETRITFVLKLLPINKTLGLAAKSSKTLYEALESTLLKNGLKPQEMKATLDGETKSLNMNMSVLSLANKTVIVDRLKGKEHSSVPAPGSPVMHFDHRSTITLESEKTAVKQMRGVPKPRNPAQRRTYDMDGLIDLLSKAQSNRANDQRGLLSKENLIIPQFLQLSVKEEETDEDDEMEGIVEKSLSVQKCSEENCKDTLDITDKMSSSATRSEVLILQVNTSSEDHKSELQKTSVAEGDNLDKANLHLESKERNECSPLIGSSSATIKAGPEKTLQNTV